MNNSIDPLKLRQLLSSLQSIDPQLAGELADIRKRQETRQEAIELASLIQSSGNIAGFEGFDTAFALEAIVLRKGRPVLTIHKGDADLVFPDAESEVWRDRLMLARPGLMETIPAVGRIELENAAMSWVGTGWLVDDQVVVTNRHVAEIFGRSHGSRFTFRQGINGEKVTAQLDFLEEYGRDEESRFTLEEILHIEPEPGPDMAFLRVAPSDDGGALPAKILFSDGPTPTSLEVAVIGYPARDSRVPDQALMEKIFGDVYDKKRLSPGRITRADQDRIYHDCSTLGGCSGGVVLNLQTGQAVGLHFAGRFLESNYAVPISRVAEKLKEITAGSGKVGSLSAASRDSKAPQFSMPAPTTLNQAHSITVPLQLQITLAGGLVNQQAGVSLRNNPPAREVDFIDEDEISEGRIADYAGRQGYQENFLGEGIAVPLPEVVGERWENDVLTYSNNGTEDHVLPYQHFSVVMCRSRRLCFFSAVNINGRRSKKLGRVGWRLDPRIPREAQIIRECYGDFPKYSRGHMARREDPVWGQDIEAMQGNADSMCVTNAVPQMQAFNAPIWLGLEDYALDHARADKMNISVFTGPVFRSNDKVEQGVKIPVLFWKVIVFLHDATGALSATGYMMSQKDQLPDSEFVFGGFGNSQVPISMIEQQTGLSFGDLKNHDPLNKGEESIMVPLADKSQIRFL